MCIALKMADLRNAAIGKLGYKLSAKATPKVIPFKSKREARVMEYWRPKWIFTSHYHDRLFLCVCRQPR